MLNREPVPYQWALPESLEVPPDELQVRLDFYQDAILMHALEKGVIFTRLVSALDICQAMTREMPLSSGLLPQDTLWWASNRNGPVIALWRSPRIWKVALMLEPFKPPRRLALPMPGLIFLCSLARAPCVWAAKRRPQSLTEKVYHAPLFNVFQDGRTCPGTHRYSDNISKIPESFFLSFFSPEGHHAGRSKKHPQNLLALWEEIDGKKRFPLSDLVEFGTVANLINEEGRW